MFVVVLQDKMKRGAEMFGHYLLRRARMPLCAQSCHPNPGNGLGWTSKGSPSGHCRTPQSADLAAQVCPARRNRGDISYVLILLWLVSLVDNCAILCVQPGAWTQLALLLRASRHYQPFCPLFCHKVLRVGSHLEHSALFHVCDVLSCILCAKPGTVGADVLDIVNINYPKLGDVRTPYLFNVEAQQSCIPHTQSRDPHRSDVAVPQSLMNHSVCVGQSFAVFIADDVGRFQNSLHLPLNSLCSAITMF